MKIAAALVLCGAMFAFTSLTEAAPVSGKAATPPATAALYSLDPYLAGASNLADIDLSTFLSGNPDLADYTAASLVADGTSAAIVLFQSNSSAPVTFTVNGAASLQPYSALFLKQAPATGQASLTVSSLFKIGASYYAAALVQGPLTGYSASANSIALQATQNSTSYAQNLSLVVPPVVLVHGLWGDKTSLNNVQHYLDSTSPWRNQTKLVQRVCYSLYLAFNAATDPLTTGSDPCEVTSQTAVQNEIDALLAELDSAHIVGARVDLVAHSMGGLAARYYASQGGYASLRNRMQGQIHAIVTLDAPEIGSALAPYLISVRNNRAKAPIWTVPGFVWFEVCGNSTVAQCFDANGYPIYSPKLAVDTGAVYSLTPGGPDLTNPQLSGPDISNSTWRAVSARAPSNSALELGLNTLIAALYSNPNASSVPTINSLLQNPNDAIVTLGSQTNGAQAEQYYTFPNLSHTSLVGSILTYLSLGLLNDNSVVDDPTGHVYQLAGCWLEKTGAASCIPPMATANESAATPMLPRAFKPVDRIVVTSPATAELGKPFEVAVRLLAPNMVPQLSVYQRGEEGRTRLEPVAGTRRVGNTIYASVIPKQLGPVRLSVSASFADGGVSGHAVNIFVAPPKAPPLSFQANELPTAVINLNARNTTFMPHPQALYADPVGEVYLNTRFVTYQLVPQAQQAVIRVDANGIIHALAPGEATVEAHYGSVSDRLNVIVRAVQQ